MPYFVAIGHSDALPLVTKMGKVSLNDGTSLGIPVIALFTEQEVSDHVNKFLEIIKEKNNAGNS